MRARSLTRLALVAISFGIVSPAAARADVFGPIVLASEGSVGGGEPLQAEYAHDAVISADGHYVAFDGSVGGATGVWRLDRTSGELQQVAGGDAQLPSISETGRYVSFTTNEGRRLPAITAALGGESAREAPGAVEAVNVYVRDMSVEPGAEGAFSAASAPSGSSEALTYAGELAAKGKLGSTAAGRSAISLDGREVVFVTTAVSNLVQGAGGAPETPALQVAVRHLDTQQTVLVSTSREGGPVLVSEGGSSYGAVFPGTRREFGPVPVYGESGNELPGASLSGDGSTVAWMGEDIGSQVSLLSGEGGRRPFYTEPLWRRIADGSQTPTERVTGGSDPGNPACAASGETSLPSPAVPSDPCQGPFSVSSETGGTSTGIWASEGGDQGNFIPQLSADGYQVAFLSEAPLANAGENFGRTRGGQPSDAYVANMHPGLTRDQAITQLTELGGGEEDRAGSLPVFDLAVSPDGRQVALVTRRTQFPLGSPALVSPPTGEPGLNELFDANLEDQTLTRITHGYSALEEPSAHPHQQVASGLETYPVPGDGAASPSFSGDGALIAFSSTASNLVYGDGNTPPAGPTDGSDAFLAERVTFAPLPTSQVISAMPQLSVQPEWRLSATARSASDGSVVLYVETPGAGTLAATATASVRVQKGGRAARRRRRHRAHSQQQAASRYTVSARSVAMRSEQVGGTVEPVMLTLRLSAPYAPLAATAGGVSATVELRFSSPGHATIGERLDVTFVRPVHGHQARKGRGSRRRYRR